VIKGHEDELVMEDTQATWDGTGKAPKTVDNTGRDGLTMIVDSKNLTVKLLADETLRKAIQDVLEPKLGQEIYNKEITVADLQAKVNNWTALTAEKVVAKAKEKVQNIVGGRFETAVDATNELLDQMSGELQTELKNQLDKLTQYGSYKLTVVDDTTENLPTELGKYVFHTFSYGMVYAKATLEIVPMPVKLTVVNAEMTIGEEAPAFTYTALDENGKTVEIAAEDVQFKVLDQNNEEVTYVEAITEAGEYTIQASVNEEKYPNYAVELINGVLTIQEKLKCNLAAIEVSCEAEIVLRLKTFIPEELLEDENAYVLLTKYGKRTVETKLTAAELLAMGTDSKGRYVLEQGVASGEMTSNVTMEIFDGNGNAVTIVDYADGIEKTVITRNVLDYARRILEVGSEKQKKLITALVTYGGYAQIHFDVDAENPAYNVLGEYGIETPSLSGFTAESIAQELTKSETSIGITQSAQQAFLDAALYQRVYFVLDEGSSIENYNFSLKYTENYVEKTKPVEPVYEASRNRYYVDILDIPAAYMDYMYEITVTNKTTGEEYSVSTSMLVFVKLALQKFTDEDQLNALRAMYYYNQAANEFFGK